MKEIHKEYGSCYMEERDYKFSQEKKEDLLQRIMVQKELPAFTLDIEKVSYLDGCKVYFKNGGWIIARFSGTEPLLRIFCEMPDRAQAAALCDHYENWLGLKN